MRILHVIDTLDLGGAERVCFTMLTLFANTTTHTVDVLELKRRGPLASQLPPSVKQWSFNRKKRFHPLHLYRLSKVLKQYDVIHVQQRKPLKEVLVASLLFNVKALLLLHDHFGNIKIKKKNEVFISWFKHRFEYVGVNAELVAWARAVMGLDDAHTVVLPNIISKNYDWYYKGSSVPGNPLQLILVSNFRPVKNIEFAVRAIAHLRSRGKNVHLTIYGQPVVNEYFQSVCKLIESQGMGSYITIVSDCDDVQKCLSPYDLAIHTSKSEAHPLVLLEFAAYGIPFLAYNSCELVQRLGDTFPLVRIDVFDLDQWETQIDRLYTNRMTISESLKKYFVENYSSELYIQTWIKIYQSAYERKFSSLLE